MTNKRDQSDIIEQFRKEFWEQYPIDCFRVKFHPDLILEVLKEIEGLEDKCRNEGMYPY